MVCNSHWVYVLCKSSEILNTRNSANPVSPKRILFSDCNMNFYFAIMR
jgi:hypothetical protein